MHDTRVKASFASRKIIRMIYICIMFLASMKH